MTYFSYTLRSDTTRVLLTDGKNKREIPSVANLLSCHADALSFGREPLILGD